MVGDNVHKSTHTILSIGSKRVRCKLHDTDHVRAFALYVEQQNAGGEGRNTGLVLTNLQAHDDNLEVGSLFDHDGFVKISRVDRPHPRGSLGTTGLGSVTVIEP